jgi:cytochrome c oxidase subunit 2
MDNQIPMFPENASTICSQVDLVYLYLTLVCAIFAIGVVIAIVYFAIRYRRNPTHTAIQQIEGSHLLEIAWSVVPLILMMTMFGWGAWLYVHAVTPPKGAMDIYVVGKQWMWKAQHPTGQREINDLHVPVNTPVRLTMTSEDVIHSYYIPSFRMKRDSVPGRYSQAWFEATKPGTYHIFCAEFCGTKHSQMIGQVHVLSAEDYANWLAGNQSGDTAEEAGKKLFEANRCSTCHHDQSGARGPNLAGVFGSQVKLKDGSTVLANEEFIRESILRPQAKTVVGFEPVMPTYEGQLSEEQVLQLLAYIKTLAGPAKEAK